MNTDNSKEQPYIFNKCSDPKALIQEIFNYSFPQYRHNIEEENSRGTVPPVNIHGLLHCPWCKKTPYSSKRTFEQMQQYEFCCSAMYCHECNAEWYVCASCSLNDNYPLHHAKGGNSRSACHERKK